MFKTASRRSSFKSFLPRINHPIPLSQHESKSLLNVLKTSFRAQLDAEHGVVQKDATANTQRPRQRPPADQHLDAILSNPLFSRTTRPARILQSDTPRDPMDIFDEAVSKGMMTLRAAHACLVAKRKQIINSSTISVREAMASSGAGIRITRWLRSSGHERALDFIEPGASLVGELTPFLVAEGYEELIWMWVERLVAQGSSSDIKAASILVSNIVRNKSNTMHGGSVDRALSTVLRVDDTYHLDPNFRFLAARPWQGASSMLTYGWFRREPPNPVLVDALIEMASKFRLLSMSIDVAHILLHHPTNPTSDNAVHFFQHKPNWERLVEGLKVTKSPSTGMLFTTRRMVNMGVDAIRYLAGNGRNDEAQWILRLLEANFPASFRRIETVPWRGDGLQPS